MQSLFLARFMFLLLLGDACQGRRHGRRRMGVLFLHSLRCIGSRCGVQTPLSCSRSSSHVLLPSLLCWG